MSVLPGHEHARGPAPEPGHEPGHESVEVRRYSPEAQLRLQPPHAVVRLSGELDVATAGGFRRAVDDALPDVPLPGAVRSVVVDLREVTFLDSAGLAVLARLVRRSPEHECTVCLVGVRRPVRTSLRISGLLDAVVEREEEELCEESRRVLG